jgi:hypothetical protein
MAKKFSVTHSIPHSSFGEELRVGELGHHSTRFVEDDVAICAIYGGRACDSVLKPHSSCLRWVLPYPLFTFSST